jgi:glycosyltransferase involved in cell wall biosynthesis
MKEPNKVSVCIPAYNKESEIGAMLESVYNQKYNNIEVNIVNNGSTDRTFEIIREWEPRFIERGYEVVIVDRENRGLADSAKTLLTMATGDYICMPDADDILHPEYVSDMARALDENDDVMWVQCYSASGSEYKPEDLGNRINWWICGKIPHGEVGLALYAVGCLSWSVWAILFRREFMIKCKVIERFETSPNNHEIPLVIPIVALGNGYILSRQLYFYNTGSSTFLKFDADQHGKTIDLIIELLNMTLTDMGQKTSLLDYLSEIGRVRHKLFRHCLDTGQACESSEYGTKGKQDVITL